MILRVLVRSLIQALLQRNSLRLTGTQSSLVLDNHLDIAWRIPQLLFGQQLVNQKLDLLPFDRLNLN